MDLLNSFPHQAPAFTPVLDRTRPPSTDPALIDFAFSFWPDGGWDIRERNVYQTEGRFTSGDVFRVAVVSGVVQYYQNGVLVYTSLVQPAAILVIDTSLISANATLISALTSATAPSPINLATAGGTLPFQWSITSGALPPGLSLNTTTGTISGVPTQVGTWKFTVQVIDSASPPTGATRSFSVKIRPRL